MLSPTFNFVLVFLFEINADRKLRYDQKNRMGTHPAMYFNY
jgi:hypothetical protein